MDVLLHSENLYRLQNENLVNWFLSSYLRLNILGIIETGEKVFPGFSTEVD